MRIPLSDPIWSRLASAYGVQHVNKILSDLSRNWDEALARDLFWEKLHHQQSLYPATFAALPWTMHIHDARDEAELETLIFISYVLYLTCTFHKGASEGVHRPGADTPLSHFRIPGAEGLPISDQPVLRALETWLIDTASALARACLAALPLPGRTESEARALALALADAALHGHFQAACVLEMLSDGFDPDEIVEELELTQDDRPGLVRLAKQLDPTHPDLGATILACTGLHRPDPNQLTLPF